MDSWAQTSLTHEWDLEGCGTVPVLLQNCSITRGKPIVICLGTGNYSKYPHFVAKQPSASQTIIKIMTKGGTEA